MKDLTPLPKVNGTIPPLQIKDSDDSDDEVVEMQATPTDLKTVPVIKPPQIKPQEVIAPKIQKAKQSSIKY